VVVLITEDPHQGDDALRELISRPITKNKILLNPGRLT
jgi:hypothetical protein